MAKKQRHVRWQLVLTALALMGISGSVAAQDSTCEVDDDCDHGYSCEVVGGGSSEPCAGAPPCGDDGDCPPPPECNEEPAEVIMGCVPATDCTQNGDCAEGWVCAREERERCEGGDAACSSDGECPEPEPAQCETEVLTQCVPQWVAPCEADSCGPGFDCVERIDRTCTDSGSTPGAGGSGGGDDPGSGFAPPQDAGVEGDPMEEPAPPEATCTEEPSGEFRCELQHVTCATNADCQAGLTCQDSPVSGGCTRPADPPEMSGSGGADGAGVDAGAADGDAPPDGEGDTPEPCELPEPERICAPEGYFEYGGSRGDDVAGGVSSGDNEGGGEGAPQAPDDATDGDSNSSGTGGLPTMSGSEESAEEEDSGCRATGGAPTSSLGLIGLALAALVMRRKQRRA